MDLPSVPVKPQDVIDEYHSRLSNYVAANIRLTLMVHELVNQREDALNRWLQADESAKMWEARYHGLEEEITTPSTNTIVERRIAS